MYFGAEICKIFWENAEIFGRNFWTVSWWDSNTLQKFFNFFENEKSSGWYYTLYRIKNFLSVLHLDDLEWSRSRETKNSYHKWIHMATTNEVHCSTFNFLLISEKSYFRISLKNVFLTSLIIIKLHQSYQRKWAVNGWSGPSKMIQMVHWLEEVNE